MERAHIIAELVRKSPICRVQDAHDAVAASRRDQRVVWREAHAENLCLLVLNHGLALGSPHWLEQEVREPETLYVTIIKASS